MFEVVQELNPQTRDCKVIFVQYNVLCTTYLYVYNIVQYMYVYTRMYFFQPISAWISTYV
jgi:hypothetical protein